MKKNRFFIGVLALTFFHIANARDEELCSSELVQKDSAVVQTQMEMDAFHRINQSRVANSLPPLTWSNAVATQARNHSMDMANQVVPFGHQGMDVRDANLIQSIPSLMRYRENIAYNSGDSNPAATAVSGWLKSQKNYKNIMGDYSLTGIGVAKNSQGRYYFTQIFIKTYSTSLNPDQEIEEISEQ